MACEHRLDGLPVPVGEAHEHQQGGPVAQQLRDDFVGAGVVDAADAGEIDARDRHVPFGGRHLTLDALAHDAPGGPRDQVGIDAGNRFLEHRVHVDALYHRFVDPCSGMMMSTWAPGKAGRPSFKGTSSSHFGTIAIRAVPLRIAILPSHRVR